MAFTGNKRIAGITIEIGADTTKLTDALKQFDRQLDASKDSLKDIDKLLKLNPGNVTLLTQKQKELENSIGKTKERLAELKSVQQDSVSPEDWDKIQREIIETEGNLKNLEKEYENFGSVAKQQVIAAGEKMQAVGNKISAVGQSLTEKITKPIVDGFGKALSITADFDAQMSKVGAISGATGEDFDKLRAKAREMGAETKFSATEAGQAFEYMAMAGWKTDDMLEGIEGIMSLAAASGEELGTTSDIVTDALTAFGNSAEDAGDFADVLAAASSNANTNVSLMGESFKYAAAMAGGMGYNYRDVALALGLMANSGVKAGQAGRGLQNVMKRIAQPTKQSGEAMAYFNLSTINADGSQKSLREIMQDLRVEAKKQPEALAEAAEAARVLTEEYENGEISEDEYNEGMQGISNSANEFIANVGKLAGAQGLPGLLAILNASDEDFDDLAGAIDNSSGAAKEMADRMNDNLKGQLRLLDRQLEELAISIGDVLTPYARKLVGVVQKVVDKFNKLSPKTKKIAVLIGSVAAAIGPLLVGVGGFVSLAGKGVAAFGSVMKFLPAIKGGLTAIAGVLTGPVGIVAGVAAVIAIVLKATGAWDKIKASLIDAWPKIRQGAADAWEVIKVKFGEFKAYLQEKLAKPLLILRSQFEDVFNRISAAFEPVRKSAAATWDVIKGIFNGWNSFGDLKIMLGDLWNELKKFGGKLGKILSETDWAAIGSEAWSLVTSAFSPVGDWIKELVLGDDYTPDATWAEVGGKLWASVTAGFKAVGDWIKSLVLGDDYTPDSTWGDVGGKIWGVITAGISAVGDWIKGLVLGDEYTPESTWGDVGGKIWGAITAGIKATGDWIKSLVLGDEYTPESTWGDVGGKIWGAITAGFKATGDWIKQIVLGDDYTPDASWSQVGGKLWAGIVSGMSDAVNWLSTLFSDWTAKLSGGEIDFASVGGTIWNAISGAFSGAVSWFTNLFGGTSDTDANSVKGSIAAIDWAGLGTSVLDLIGSAFLGVGEIYKGYFVTAWNSINGLNWAGLGRNMWKAIKTAFKNVTSWFKETFKAPINAVIGFLNDMIERVQTAINTVINGINSALSISIPSLMVEPPDWMRSLGMQSFGFPGFDWSPNISTVNWGRPIKKLAGGGVLSNGQRAIVGEYAPEYLRVLNGRAVVTPIENGGRDQWRMGQNTGTVNNNITINQLPGESSEQLAARVQRVLVRWDQQKKAAYGR